MVSTFNSNQWIIFNMVWFKKMQVWKKQWGTKERVNRELREMFGFVESSGVVYVGLLVVEGGDWQCSWHQQRLVVVVMENWGIF